MTPKFVKGGKILPLSVQSFMVYIHHGRLTQRQESNRFSCPLTDAEACNLSRRNVTHHRPPPQAEISHLLPHPALSPVVYNRSPKVYNDSRSFWDCQSCYHQYP